MLTRDPPVTVAVSTSLEELERLTSVWDSLLRITPGGSGFQSLGWIRACWEYLARDHDRLFVTAVARGDVVIAIFPTMVRSGCLSFIGRGVSNYAGPVYDPTFANDVVTGWSMFLGGERSVSCVDLFGLRDGTPFTDLVQWLPIPRLGRPLVSTTNVCPETDLREGWTALLGRHKSKQRASWKKKERRLSSLGDLRFVETEDPSEITAAMPRMSSLLRARWEGQRISGGLAPQLEPFHAAAAKYAGKDGHLRLSTLTLDGEIIAFSYGVRSGNITTSYLLAHDERFQLYSAGLLLVLHVLEAAAERGDPAYDFSLGSAEYKSLWATGERMVYRVLWGRRRGTRYLADRAWVRLRSVPWLRELKRRGPGAFLPKRPAPIPDSPGLPSGVSGSWFVYRVDSPGSSPFPLVHESYKYWEEHLSPRLLNLALERHFRGDDLLVAPGDAAPLAVVWRAATARHKVVTGTVTATQHGEAVFYHPVVAAGPTLEDFVANLAASGPYVIVTPMRLRPSRHVAYCGRFHADHFMDPVSR
jgi:CelD/BcsL family acetyltransferase involved in cellulose biosynthesis